MTLSNSLTMYRMIMMIWTICIQEVERVERAEANLQTAKIQHERMLDVQQELILLDEEENQENTAPNLT